MRNPALQWMSAADPMSLTFSGGWFLDLAHGSVIRVPEDEVHLDYMLKNPRKFRLSASDLERDEDTTDTEHALKVYREVLRNGFARVRKNKKDISIVMDYSNVEDAVEQILQFIKERGFDSDGTIHVSNRYDDKDIDALISDLQDPERKKAVIGAFEEKQSGPLSVFPKILESLKRW